jgi:hypothetical protein
VLTANAQSGWMTSVLRTSSARKARSARSQYDSPLSEESPVSTTVPETLEGSQSSSAPTRETGNTPVFFLRDPAKFPHFIHTQKRDPVAYLTSADDSTMFWDYLSQNPESIHQVMILMGDRGIPDGYRFMHGYVGHTVKIVNKAGDWLYAQFHMKSKQGIKFITHEESASKSPDHSQKDLYYAIEKGDFPSWSLEVQTMTPAQAEELWEKQRINVFDLTHIWPHKQFPSAKSASSPSTRTQRTTSPRSNK